MYCNCYAFSFQATQQSLLKRPLKRPIKWVNLKVESNLKIPHLAQFFADYSEISYMHWGWGPLPSHKISTRSVKICSQEKSGNLRKRVSEIESEKLKRPLKTH